MKLFAIVFAALAGVLLVAACAAPAPLASPTTAPAVEPSPGATAAPAITATAPEPAEATSPAVVPVADAANVISVEVRGDPGSYQFSVGIESPDTGCQQYADWWEVVTPTGELLYRRILLHSHVGEQPFVRSGGPVDIQADTPVRVRAHMNTTGYGGVMFEGSVQAGFTQIPGDADFAPELAQQPPLPDGCAF